MNIKYFEFQIFSLIIIFQSFYKISSITSFDYPYSIILSNDNIFLIQKTGIDIYDISLNKLKQIFQFSGEEEISEEKFSKITIKNNNEYILSVINDKMFIFNNEGKILYKSEKKINETEIIYSYSLTFINVTNNYFEYLLGYFDVDCYIHLNLYRYYNESNNNTLIYEFRRDSYDYRKGIGESEIKFNNKNKLLSCEYIYYPYSTNKILCFFNDDLSIRIISYEIRIISDKTINFSRVDLEKKYIYSKYLDNANIQFI